MQYGYGKVLKSCPGVLDLCWTAKRLCRWVHGQDSQGRPAMRCSQGVRLAVRNAVHGRRLWLQQPAAEGAGAEDARLRRHAAQRYCWYAAIAESSDACTQDRC